MPLFDCLALPVLPCSLLNLLLGHCCAHLLLLKLKVLLAASLLALPRSRLSFVPPFNARPRRTCCRTMLLSRRSISPYSRAFWACSPVFRPARRFLVRCLSTPCPTFVFVALWPLCPSTLVRSCLSLLCTAGHWAIGAPSSVARPTRPC